MVKFILLIAALLPSLGFGGCNSRSNNIPPRLQWDSNAGYCGEVSLISAGLYYGQYASQYDVRALATEGSQDQTQLLLGVNDLHAAEKMHLKAIPWNTDGEQSTGELAARAQSRPFRGELVELSDKGGAKQSHFTRGESPPLEGGVLQFLAWVKHSVAKGYPVAIGVYINHYLYSGNINPDAGDPDYDHIVPVTGIDSEHCLKDPTYYGDDVLHFSDNGLWPKNKPSYLYSLTCDECQDSRQEANDPDEPIYSLPSDASNYGIAITGVMDIHGDTLPVRIDTDINYESPEIEDGSNARPAPTPLTLTITISNLEPGISYNLYRYNTFATVPNSHFNAHAYRAYQSWPIQITAGSTFILTQQINSDEVAVYRCVKATAP